MTILLSFLAGANATCAIDSFLQGDLFIGVGIFNTCSCVFSLMVAVVLRRKE